MKSLFPFPLSLTVFMAFMSCAWTHTVQAANLHYGETFVFVPTGGGPLAPYNWNVNYDSGNAYDLDDNDTRHDPVVYAPGNVFHTESLNDGEDHLYWTANFTAFDISTLDHFEIDFRNESASEDLQFAFQVDGSSAWYVADQVFNSVNDTDWTTDLTFDVSSATWKTLNFSSGSTLSVAAGSVTLPLTGNVTAAGLYDANHSKRLRFDNFEIYTIPEPSGIILVLSGFMTLAWMMRKRRA